MRKNILAGLAIVGLFILACMIESSYTVNGTVDAVVVNQILIKCNDDTNRTLYTTGADKYHNGDKVSITLLDNHDTKEKDTILFVKTIDN